MVLGIVGGFGGTVAYLAAESTGGIPLPAPVLEVVGGVTGGTFLAGPGLLIALAVLMAATLSDLEEKRPAASLPARW